MRNPCGALMTGAFPSDSLQWLLIGRAVAAGKLPAEYNNIRRKDAGFIGLSLEHRLYDVRGSTALVQLLHKEGTKDAGVKTCCTEYRLVSACGRGVRVVDAPSQHLIAELAKSDPKLGEIIGAIRNLKPRLEITTASSFNARELIEDAPDVLDKDYGLMLVLEAGECRLETVFLEAPDPDGDYSILLVQAREHPIQIDEDSLLKLLEEAAPLVERIEAGSDQDGRLDEDAFEALQDLMFLGAAADAATDAGDDGSLEDLEYWDADDLIGNSSLCDLELDAQSDEAAVKRAARDAVEWAEQEGYYVEYHLALEAIRAKVAAAREKAGEDENEGVAD